MQFSFLTTLPGTDGGETSRRPRKTAIVSSYQGIEVSLRSIGTLPEAYLAALRTSAATGGGDRGHGPRAARDAEVRRRGHGPARSGRGGLHVELARHTNRVHWIGSPNTDALLISAQQNSDSSFNFD